TVELPFNQDVMSYDDNRNDGRLSGGASLPAELIPEEIVSESVHFKMGNKEDGENNAVSCKGQKIDLPAGDYNKLYILASAEGRAIGDFLIDGQSFPLKIQNWRGYTGQFYNRRFAQDGVTVTRIDTPFLREDNIAWYASHYHAAYPSKNETYQYSYIFKYGINLPQGAKTITLPDNGRIKVFAITLVKAKGDDIKVLQPLYDDLNNCKPVALRNN
ncbi:MAG: alpha-mannosidase, partial [Bacteroidota bacterium]|nr:alpha-mannosidase [Bacteroidota bacterium]